MKLQPICIRHVATHCPAGSRQAVAPRCQAAAADAAKASGGTPVPKNAILVVGATGTLGRQVRCSRAGAAEDVAGTAHNGLWVCT